jgi:hypothetical protein
VIFDELPILLNYTARNGNAQKVAVPRLGHRKRLMGDKVLEEHLAGFRGKSLRDDKRFARMWNRLFPNIRLNGISASGLKKARTVLLEGRQSATVNRYMAFIRKVLNVAVAEGRMANNPMDQVKMFKESTGATRFL